MTQSDSFPSETRSAAEVMGIALLIGMVIIGVSVILMVALSQIDDGQDEIEISQAEEALTEFDAEALRVASDSTSSQTIELGLQGNSGTLDVDNESGHILVEYFDSFNQENRTEVLNTTLGAVTYENGQTTVAYQGGGVWRSDGSGSVLVSPPEFSFENDTLTMPVIETRRGGSVHSDVEITSVNASEQLFPDRTAETSDLTNRINDGIVVIVIQSQYYEAWARFFEEETNTYAETIDAEQKAVVTFFGSQYNFSPDAGIIATAGPGTLRIEGSGSYIDSYDSFEAPYEEGSPNGSVKAAGDIDMYGGSLIEGDAESNSRILLDGSSEITGDACAESVEKDGDAIIGGDTDCEGHVPVLPALDPLVELMVEDLSSNNNNDDTAAIDAADRQLVLGDDETAELGPGRYYLEEIEFKAGETLRLNATGGDITVVVENYVTLDEGNIEVKGNNTDGTVQMFIATKEDSGETVQGTGGEPADHLYVNKNSTISVNNDHSPRFQLFAPRDFTGGIRSSGSVNAQVAGVILAPTRGRGPSQFIVRDSELFGAVVTGNLTVENNAEVHFDQATSAVEIPFGKGTSLLDFLHVTRHEIEVDGS